ncbi:GNAT family N-acetyltransferase [Pseudomonas xionganensis]|uniref:GNAT family N-acetyltransferase n=1 Tax=Pseudomonas xionganensis TaxID=2654845 RepID=A0A6I4KP53_9PSED|nr:GNAT family N-acetyltransferase [Pseudomonas xionganensis]MVW74105.1 GNAT family N-acetyltransferase [Pseudomonas xionganensis]
MSTVTPLLRPYQPDDLDALLVLFNASVQQLAASHYDQTQRRAWAPESVDRQAWARRLAAQQVLLGECQGQMAGFIGFDLDGHIDLLFSHPEHARQGVAQRLYQAAEAELRAAGVSLLHTEASLLAQPFFARQGFVVVEQQEVQRGDVSLPRALMHKALSG